MVGAFGQRHKAFGLEKGVIENAQFHIGNAIRLNNLNGCATADIKAAFWVICSNNNPFPILKSVPPPLHGEKDSGLSDVTFKVGVTPALQ